MDIRSGARVALKRVVPRSERDCFPITAIREMKILQTTSHENVISLLEIIRSRDDIPCSTSSCHAVYMVFPLMKHDLVGVQHARRTRLELPEVKCIGQQILRGLEYLHSHGIVHRDLKLSNLLIDNHGIVKIADFGLSRNAIEPGMNMTNKVVTRWYRAPELLLGGTHYDQSLDMWSFGAIFAELLIGEPMFPGESEVHVLKLIIDTIGPPNVTVWPSAPFDFNNCKLLNEVLQLGDLVGAARFDNNVFRDRFIHVSSTGRALVRSFLQYNPSSRMGAGTAAVDVFFVEEPLPCDPKFIRLPQSPCREQRVKESHGIYPPRTRSTRKRGSSIYRRGRKI
jgi:cyclin-dependent kinase 12/13